MATKFEKIEKFIESINVDEMNENEQALMLAGNDLFGGSNSTNIAFCTNRNNCEDSSNGFVCNNKDIC